MVTRLYVNNFLSLVACNVSFDSFGVLCGYNGAGKTSIMKALRFVRDVAIGKITLGNAEDAKLCRTNWLESKTQEFEIELVLEQRIFKYIIHIEQLADHEKPRIIKECALCDGVELFSRDRTGVKIHKKDGGEVAFPLDWRQSAIASIYGVKEIETLKDLLENILIIRPNPITIEHISRAESQFIDTDMSNLISWYRHFAQEQDWTDVLRDSLRMVWSDFRSFRLSDMGNNVKTLELRFETTQIYFEQLSDGEKMLIALYMIHAALATEKVATVLIDEPDNYVSTQELQPWLLSVLELLNDRRQLIIISHNPEIIDSVSSESCRYLWRDNHASPTRIEPLHIPQNMTASEAITRGWIEHA
ncbi:hypothetical protein AGMMS50229_04650 [Campylobacterota bacterium]|nr:hypothetical protein AGMMS50229_04650 [Campylobacterota bacterium]